MKLIDLAGSCSLTFECGDLPADVAAFAAGHVPNGYFWEGVVQYFERAFSVRESMHKYSSRAAACWPTVGLLEFRNREATM